MIDNQKKQPTGDSQNNTGQQNQNPQQKTNNPTQKSSDLGEEEEESTDAPKEYPGAKSINTITKLQPRNYKYQRSKSKT